MSKLWSVLSLAVGLSAAISTAQASDLTVAIGQSGDSEMVYRLGLQWDWQQRWWQSPSGFLSGYWDLGYSYWQGSDTSSKHSVSFSPVLVYEFATDRVRPYIELGVGAAVFSGTRIESNQLGSSFQFEDRIGFGLRFADHEVGLRAIHYSNAGIKQPNDGVEAYTLHYRTRF